MLGNRYRDGQGVPRDMQKAYEHYNAAASAGDVDALVFLAARARPAATSLNARCNTLERPRAPDPARPGRARDAGWPRGGFCARFTPPRLSPRPLAPPPPPPSY